MYKPLCLAMLLCMAGGRALAQQPVRTVVDAVTHQPIPGVVVSDSRHQPFAVSDSKGRFSLPSSSGDTLRFSAGGYKSRNLPAAEAAGFISLTPAFADLNEIIISGSREAQRRTEVPVAVNVVSKAVINDTKATRLDMLLNKVPGVFMVDLGNEQHEMSVRQPLGTGNLFLYLEDGIPIRTVGDFNHNALIEINQASMERIEVIKGPASSLYGSEAVGGAMNFITQAPSPFLTGKVQAETGSRGYKRTDFSISDTWKKGGLFAAGYVAGQHQPADQHNDFRKGAFTLRGDWAFSDKLKLTAVADYISYHTDQKGGLDSIHFYRKDYSSFYRFTYRNVEALRTRATLTKDWNERNRSALTVFYRHSSIGQNPFYYISNTPGNPLRASGQINEDAFRSYGAVLQHTASIPSLHARLIGGASIDYSPATYLARYIDISRSTAGVYERYKVSDSALTSYRVGLLNSAAWAQLEFKPTEKLKLVAAARYDRLDYRFDNHLPPGAYTGAPDAQDHFDHFTPKVGLTYNFGRNKGAYLNYSQGFAPPNISDLYTGVKVPVLQAASYRNYEAGGWVSFAGTKGYAEVSVYSMTGNHEIVSVRLADGSYENQNAGRTRHNGLEANLRYAPFEELTVRVAAAYAEHRYIEYVQQGKDFSGNRMAQAPPFIGNGEVTYRPHYLKGLRIALELQGMSRYFTDPQNTATYKGFLMYNARLGYLYKKFEVWANCINLTDKVFATVVEKSAYGTSYRPGQLRTLNTGIAWNFSGK